MHRLLLITLTFILILTACTTAPPQAEPETTESTTMTEAPDINLVGNRFAPLTWDEMTDAQKTMTTNILAGPRTAVSGPFNVLLRSPEMGDLAQELGAYARFNSSLPGKLREMSIMMTARFWTAQYVWYTHKNIALEEGLDSAIVDAIATAQRPSLMDGDETVIYNFVNEMLNDKRVNDTTFDAAINALGEQGVVDVIGTVGYYSMASLILNVDETPIPDGVEAELQPLP